MLAEAHRRFPTAEFRILSLPRRAGDPISLRMRQPAEWLPNGRTTLWFDAATGRLLGARDALAMAPRRCGRDSCRPARPTRSRFRTCQLSSSVGRSGSATWVGARQSVVEGKSVSVRLDFVGSLIIKKNNLIRLLPLP